MQNSKRVSLVIVATTVLLISACTTTGGKKADTRGVQGGEILGENAGVKGAKKTKKIFQKFFGSKEEEVLE